MQISSLRALSSLAAAFLTLAACNQRKAPEDPAAGGEVGTVVLSLTTVPQDVRCVRVIVAGNQMVVRTFDVTPGQMAVLTAGGLPLGAATVYEEAFGVACSAVGPATAAIFVAEAPVPVVLLPNAQSSVTIVLRRASSIRATSDFREGDGVAVTPSIASFGDVPANTVGAPLTFQITNLTPNTIPLMIAFTGTNGDQFSIIGGTCAGLTILGSGGSCTVQTRFAPTSAGAKTASLSVLPAQGEAAVTGNATTPVGIHLQPGSSEFGDVAVGSLGAIKTFTALNRAIVPVALPIAIGGPANSDYQIVGGGTCATMALLQPNATCTVLLRFAPLSVGDKDASLDVGDPGDSASLFGTGIPGSGATLTPASAAFGMVAVGTPSTFATFVVNNVTSSEIALAPALGGANPADFVISGFGTCTGKTSLAVGATCTIVAALVPTAPGAKTAILTAGPGSGQAMLSGTGFIGTGAAFTPGTESFGSVVARQRTSPVHRFVVTNIGSGSFTPSIGLAGKDANQFKVMDTGTCFMAQRSLAPGDSCTADVMFLPTSGGLKTAFLAALPSFGSAAISGTGISGTGFVFDPTTKDYGDGVVDARLAPDVIFTVTNQKDSDLVPFFAFQGPDAAHFEVVQAAGTCAFATNGIGPGETCTVVTRFRPSSAGVKTAVLAAVPNGGQASVTGRGVTGAGFSFDPPSVAFGNVFVNQVSPPATITLTNISTHTLQTTMSLTGPDAGQFSKVGGTCQFAMRGIGPGETCTVIVQFTPTVGGAKTAALTDPITSSAMPLSGTGVVGVGLAFNPTSFAFGDVILNNNSSPTTFTVTNTTPGSLPLSLRFSGTDAGHFLILNGGTCEVATELRSGQSCTITTVFRPGSAGSKTATLGSPGAMGSATVTGTGIRTPGIFLDPPSVAFGDVGVGSSSTVMFTATNGSGSRQNLSKSFSGPDMNQFQTVLNTGTCQNLPDLGPGASCSFEIRFAPTTAGSKSATLVVGGIGTPAPLTGNAVISAITNLMVRDTSTTNPPAGTDGIANSTQWSVQSNFHAPVTAFGDRAFTVNATGNAVLNGKPWIRTAADSKNFAGTPLATFTLTGRFVYLLIDDRHNAMATGKPTWLDATWTDQGFNANITEGTAMRPYSVWRKSVASGSTVTLPTINSAFAPCYIVVVE